MGEDAGGLVAQRLQTDHFQDFVNPVPVFRGHDGSQGGQDAFVGGHGQFEVFEHSQSLEHGGLLEFAADAQGGNVRLVHAQQVVAAAEPHRAGVGPGFTSDDVHHGGFTRPVRTDDAAQFAVVDGEVEVVDGLEAIEAHAHVFHVQDRAVAHVNRRGHGGEKLKYLIPVGKLFKDAHAVAS